MSNTTDSFAYHHECTNCGKKVRTNVEYLDEHKLCHECGRQRRLVEKVLADKGLLGILLAMAEGLGQEPEKTKDMRVEYTCPKCGQSGYFSKVQVPEGLTEEEVQQVLSKMPMCPECMGKQVHEPTPGMPKTEGPVGPTPVIKDPDEDQKSLQE